MIDFSRRVNTWLGKRMFLVSLSALLCGAFIRMPDSPLLRDLIIALFAYMTLVTALGTSVHEFLKVLRQPLLPAWILLLVHVGGPLAALLLGTVFYPDDLLVRTGYLISASVPIGVTSILWTALVSGRVGVALVAVTLDTFLVPLILPLFFHLILDQAIALNYFDMVYGLLKMVTIPSLIGMLLYELTGSRTKTFTQGVGGATSKLALFFVVFINASLVLPQIVWNAAMLKLLLVTLLMVGSGFFVGYLGSLPLKDRSREMTLTMMHNVGIRNNSCGLVIAMTYFPPTAAIPLMLTFLYQMPLATLVSHVYPRRQPPNTGEASPNDPV